jgi:hypothetical protein
MALGYISQAGSNVGSLLELVLVGDGTSTSINIDLTLPPLGFDLKGNKPIEALTNTSGFSVALNSDRVSVTIITPTTLSNGQQTQVFVQLVFEGQ